MRRLPGALKWRASAVTGFIAGLALVLVSLPIEVTIGLSDHPVIPPGRLASLLLIGSCLLLVGSGLGLRRVEAARAGAGRPTPSA
jgi:hypothetical protein